MNVVPDKGRSQITGISFSYCLLWWVFGVIVCVWSISDGLHITLPSLFHYRIRSYDQTSRRELPVARTFQQDPSAERLRCRFFPQDCLEGTLWLPADWKAVWFARNLSFSCMFLLLQKHLFPEVFAMGRWIFHFFFTHRTTYEDDMDNETGSRPLHEEWNNAIFYHIIGGSHSFLMDRGPLITSFLSYRYVQINSDALIHCINAGQSVGFQAMWELWVEHLSFILLSILSIVLYLNV